MSAVGYAVALDTVFAMTTGAKTVLNVIASANSGLVIVEFGISFDGVTASAVHALVDLCQSTQATAGTDTKTPTVTQLYGRVTGGDPPTADGGFSAEPTALTRLAAWHVHPTSGLVIQYPLGREPITDDSGGTVKALALRANVTANVNAMAYMIVEKVG